MDSAVVYQALVGVLISVLMAGLVQFSDPICLQVETGSWKIGSPSSSEAWAVQQKPGFAAVFGQREDGKAEI